MLTVQVFSAIVRLPSTMGGAWPVFCPRVFCGLAPPGAPVQRGDCPRSPEGGLGRQDERERVSWGRVFRLWSFRADGEDHTAALAPA